MISSNFLWKPRELGGKSGTFDNKKKKKNMITMVTRFSTCRRQTMTRTKKKTTLMVTRFSKRGRQTTKTMTKKMRVAEKGHS